MNEGRIEQVGTALDLYARPRTSFVAGFIGSPPINFIDAGRLPAPAGAARIGIRPEHLYANDEGLPATVTEVEPMGRETMITCNTTFGPVRFLEATSTTAWASGQSLHLRSAEGTAILFDADGQLMDGSMEIGQIDA
jgi:sn-glycerol 3-phosphate transport system ATP-binding protein